eukprot:TRINITY_DN4563_c0_g1_i5.p1 TRINITY_DN4563_c0_g1~~TRINITY_DN4563_c0_g1_i5.p1  ORF type:complete len:227 (-),score=53.61 TRINITY_DN4563_c0_g1_i5:309-989(-)
MLLFGSSDDECCRPGFPMPQSSSCSTNSKQRASLYGSDDCDVAPQGVVAGATGLQGHSHQTFGKARKVNRDMSTLTSICFRLVVSLPSRTRVPPRPPVNPFACFPAPPRPAPVPRADAEMGLVDEQKVQDLVDMGFTDKRACRRLLFCHDGDVKKCVKELVQMERDQDAPPEEGAPPTFKWESELKTMVEEFGFEEEAQLCKDALVKYNGDMKQAIREVMTHIRNK